MFRSDQLKGVAPERIGQFPQALDVTDCLDLQTRGASALGIFPRLRETPPGSNPAVRHYPTKPHA